MCLFKQVSPTVDTPLRRYEHSCRIGSFRHLCRVWIGKRLSIKLFHKANVGYVCPSKVRLSCHKCNHHYPISDTRHSVSCVLGANPHVQVVQLLHSSIKQVLLSGEVCRSLRYCNTRPTHDRVLAS